MSTKRPFYLAPECQLGQIALAYRTRTTGGKRPTYMRLTGDGCVSFGWKVILPPHTQQPHFVDSDGTRYDCGEIKVPILTIVKDHLDSGGVL